MSKLGSGGCAVSSGQKRWALLPCLLAGLHILPFFGPGDTTGCLKKAFVVQSHQLLRFLCSLSDSYSAPALQAG